MFTFKVLVKKKTIKYLGFVLVCEIFSCDNVENISFIFSVLLT